MFKKKTKKNQGVLLVEDGEENTKPKDEGKQDLPQGQSATEKQADGVKQYQVNHGISNNKGGQIQQQITRRVQEGGDLQEDMKRSRNQDIVYLQDAHSQLENEPKRKQKQGFNPSKSKGGIGGNTMLKKQETQRQVHQAFLDIGYHAGDNLIKDMNLPKDQLEEEAAKRRYLENIETTKMFKDGKMNSKIYRGMNAYANHKLTSNDIKNAEQAYKKKMGPSRLNSTIKNTCRFDYVQNLCKDWHDSGYCPFGNSCLYLHDRSNVKTGWELEKDFEEQERQRWKRINNPDIAKKEDREKLLETIEKYKPPESCPSCQEKYNKAVEVECGHIFCSPCAIKMLKCKVCKKRLSGIMNSADDKLTKMAKNYQDLLAKLQRQQEEVQQKRRKFENTNSLDVFAD